ncbi:hypothetical protein EV175_002249, partial [Coemansia sp. RSA 1933]
IMPVPMMRRIASSRPTRVKLVLLAIALGVSLTEYRAIRQYAANADTDFCHSTSNQRLQSHQTWVLANDCLRLGVVWPVVNLVLAMGACVNLLLLPFPAPSDAGRPARSPIRMENASIVFHDNRSYMASAALIVSLVAVANGCAFTIASKYSPGSPEQKSHQRMYWQSSTVFWVTTSLVLVRDLVSHAGGSSTPRSGGLFHWSVAVGALAQLGLSALLEGYYAFFTGVHVNEPLASTLHSRFVMVSIALSLAAALLPLNAHRNGFYLSLGRPKEGSTDISNNETQPMPGTEFSEYHTPLTRIKPNQMPVVMSPESSSSLLGQLTFGWVTPVLRLATRYAIDSTDLYHLDANDQPLSIWRRYTRCRKPKQSLLRTLGVTFAPQLIAQAVLAFVSAVLAYAGPFFLQRILRSIRLYGEDSSDGSEVSGSARRMIYLDAIGMLLFSILHSMTTNRVLWIGRRISMRLHGLLVAELSSKALRRRSKSSSAEIKADDAKETDDNEDDTTASSDGRLANMLTSDLESVGHISSYLDDIYTLPIGFFLGAWYLYSLLGVPALIGLTLSAIYYPLTKLMVKYHIKFQKRLMTLDDERVTMITEMFQGIRAVKLFGWQARFIAKVRAKREEEISAYWRLILFQLPVSFVQSLTNSSTLVAILATYTLGFGHTLTADIVFPSITVFSMVSSTFNSISSMFRWLTGCYVSLKRIESFMTQTQIQDLEDRVNPVEDDDVLALGFSSACLVWDTDPVSSQQNAQTELEAADSHSDRLCLSPIATTSPTSTATPVATTPHKGSQTKIDMVSEDSDEYFGLSESTPLLSNNIPSTSYATTNVSLADKDASSSEALAGTRNKCAAPGFALTDITLRFPVGGLSIVVGPTGCGKSSLLAALVGEMTLTSGRITIPTTDPHSYHLQLAEEGDALNANRNKYAQVAELAGQGLMMRDIAYVSQEAWLRNATIRENILFNEPYDKERYEEVLRVCALKPDMRIFVAGDQTEIGERGVTLSGGQKQRVALARAVYSSRRIMLIDDCLSAVDSHTAKHILMECLVGKTKLMQGRTRILVTHHVAMCLPHTQYVVMMHEGQITMKGVPSELQSQGSLSAILEDLEESRKSDAMVKKPSDKESKGKSIEGILDGNSGQDDDVEEKERLAKSVNDTKPEDEYNTERLRNIAEQKGLDPDSDISALQGTLVEEEEREEGYVRPEIWFQYMRMCGPWWYWAITVGFIIAARLATIASDYWVRLWMSSTSSVGDGAQRSVATWLGVYVLAGVGITVIQLSAMVNENAGSMRAALKYHEELFTRVVNATPRFFDKTPIGRVISRFSSDMQTIDGGIIFYIAALIVQIAQVGSVFVIISMVTPPFVVIALAMTAAYALMAVYYLNATRELKRMDSITMSPLLSLFSELITGVESIRAFGAQSQYTLEAMGRVDTHNRPYYLMWAANRWLCTRIEFSGCIVSFSATVLILASLDRIDAGLAGFVLMYAISFSSYMLWFIRNYSECEISMNAVERVNQYLVLEQEAPAFVDAEHRPPPSWPATGSVTASDLVVEYVPGTPVLHGISFSVKHGEKIGVVGRTGAGKSTLSLAFLRFVEASSGSIIVDGVDISKIGLEELRRNVTIIPQDPSLFNGTIRFNLDPFDEFPEELLWDSLRRSHLVYEETAKASEQSSDAGSKDVLTASRMSGIFTSLDADIKENGQNLSLGQRQLVALARALVRRSRLIIMDEATASVDFDTDHRIQRTIRGPEFANSTLICVAHRLRTIIDYDRVLVLDKGKVAEFDTPYNLLQSEDGIFKSMCEKSGEYEHLVAAAAASNH